MIATTPRSTRRRAPMIAAIFIATALAITGCTGGDTGLPGTSGASGAANAGNAEDALLTDAPVAAASLILPGSTMAAIKKRGKLVVGTSFTGPLISQQDPADPTKISGIDADFAKMFAKYIIGKPNVEWVATTSQTREAMLDTGAVDVIFNTYSITEKRALQVDFAGPYLTAGLGIAVKADNKSIKGIKDLAGKTVLVQTASIGVTAVAEAQPTAKLLSFTTTPQLIEALVQGRGDAFVQDYAILASQSSVNKKIKVVGQPFTTDSYGIGLKKNDSEYKKFINNWLTSIEKSGLWLKTWKATLGTVLDNSQAPTPPKIGSVPGS